ncbi:MAG: hypothetical protein HY537_13250 [Deltaproteobacteria bacterium]|nr:hypothetical protein [Deltaproteobacteria bacterium]
MLCLPPHPEEFRDLDAYERVSRGELPYKNFTWMYGPLSPLVYGAALKILPTTLLSLRIVGLLLWTLATIFSVLILCRYFKSALPIVFGALIATGTYGYPTYTFNHVLATLGLLGATYFLLRFIEESRGIWLTYSALFLHVTVFSRPILTGYGALACWVAIVFVVLRNKTLFWRRFGSLVAPLLGMGLVFSLILGKHIVYGFVPRSWVVLPPLSYPNLTFVIPNLGPGILSSGELLIKALRGSLETLVFYIHYFVFPSALFTAIWLKRHHMSRSLTAAGILLAFSLLSSADVLHYGYPHPLMEQLMLVRGQFFFVLAAIAFILVMWPTQNKNTEKQKLVLACKVTCLGALALWSYMPWIAGVHKLLRAEINPYGVPVMKGIASHRDQAAYFESRRFLDGLCTPNDYALVPFYAPGLRFFVRCQVFDDQDVYLFSRMPAYVLQAGETPYFPNGNITNGQVIATRLQMVKPGFYLTTSEDCKGPIFSGWKTRDFVSGAGSWRVCWKQKRPLLVTPAGNSQN